MVTTLERVEWAGALMGLGLVAGSWVFGSSQMAWGVALGALFASVNFRLLVWSWRGYIDAQVAQQQAAEGKEAHEEADQVASILPRFLLKYAILMAGIFLLVGGLKVHTVGFLLGLGNVILAAAVSPLLLRKESTKGTVDPSHC